MFRICIQAPNLEAFTNLPPDLPELEKDKVALFTLRKPTPAIRFRNKAGRNGANGLGGFELALAHPPSDDAEVGHDLEVSVRRSSPAVNDRGNTIHLEEVILYGAVGQPDD